jgi:hypothetical protein
MKSPDKFFHSCVNDIIVIVTEFVEVVESTGKGGVVSDLAFHFLFVVPATTFSCPCFFLFELKAV